MNYILLIIVVYTLGLGSCYEFKTSNRDSTEVAKSSDSKWNTGLVQEHSDSEFPRTQIVRENSKSFLFHSQGIHRKREATGETGEIGEMGEAETAVVEIGEEEGTQNYEDSSSSMLEMPTGSANPNIVLYSRKSWIKEFLKFKAEDEEAGEVTSQSVIQLVEIDVDELIDFLMTKGYEEEDLQFLKTNLDYGFDEIERELRRIKQPDNKNNKHIDIGGEDGQKSPKESGSDSLALSLQTVLFILAIYLI